MLRRPRELIEIEGFISRGLSLINGRRSHENRSSHTVGRTEKKKKLKFVKSERSYNDTKFTLNYFNELDVDVLQTVLLADSRNF